MTEGSKIQTHLNFFRLQTKYYKYIKYTYFYDNVGFVTMLVSVTVFLWHNNTQLCLQLAYSFLAVLLCYWKCLW